MTNNNGYTQLLYIRMPWGKSDANTNVTIVTNFTNQNMIPNKDSNYK